MTSEPASYRHGDLLLVIDCADLDRSAAFWAAALGYVRERANGERYRSLLPATGAADQSPGCGEQAEPQAFGFPPAGGSVEGEHLHPGQQFTSLAKARG